MSGRRARRTYERQLAHAAAELARSVRSGASLPTAVDELARVAEPPLSVDVVTVHEALRRGVAVDDALADWSRRVATSSVELLVTAARLGHAEGGDLAAALDAVAVSLLDRIEVDDEAHALGAQARASMWALLALPPFGAACFALLDPAVGRTLVATPAGWACLAVGVSLELSGATVMSRLVASVQAA
jgi:tight adherence protein B